MSAQIVSARSTTDGQHGIAGHLGRGPVVGVAIVALLVSTLLGGHALTQPRSASHDANATNRSAPSSSVSTAQYHDDLMVRQDDFLHTMAARADTPRVNTGERQRFLEENTTLLSATAPQSIGLTGCNDEMLCLSMYAPNPAATGGAAVSGCGGEMMCPWMYGRR